MKRDLKPTTATPKVTDFIEVRAYLEAVYEARKSEETGFSYTTWAAEIGLQSRTFLKMIVAGKRSITDRSLTLFVRGLRLEGSDADYFSSLVRLQRTSSGVERTRQIEALCQRRPSRARPQPVIDSFRFLSSTLGPRLQALLTLERGNGWTAVGLATILGVKRAEVDEVLRILVSLDLAQSLNVAGGETVYRSLESEFEVPDQLGSEALQSFHRKSLDEAVRAIESDVQSRRYHAQFVFLTPEELVDLHARVQAFAFECLQKFPGDAARAGTRLYQMNTNLIPISGPILQTEKSSSAPVEPYLTADSSADLTSQEIPL